MRNNNLVSILFFFASIADVSFSSSPIKKAEDRVVKGEFKIERLSLESPITVQFKNIDPDAEVRKIIFRSEAVHNDLFEFHKEKVLPIRATRARVITEGTIEASQILINLPKEDGRVLPIILVSSLFPESLQISSGFLELHSPDLDFIVR